MLSNVADAIMSFAPLLTQYKNRSTTLRIATEGAALCGGVLAFWRLDLVDFRRPTDPLRKPYCRSMVFASSALCGGGR